MRRLVPIAFVVLALFLALSYFRPGGAVRDATVTIPSGASLSSAASQLEAAGAVRSAQMFLAEARMLGASVPIKPGEYRIRAGMTNGQVLALLQSGKVLQRLVTIPEGMPSVLVHERLMAVPLLTGDIPVPPEGSVLPDTYAYSRGEARSAVLARMQKAMQTALANAWANRKPTAAVTSPEEALVLASIIEKETGRPEERRLVAAVYSNRLKRGMQLQADPTVIYPVTKGRPLGRRILRSELDSDNPYNTYRRRGLPPGPIANPGKASILAALDPAPSNALYFVAQADGSSAFADTLDQHNANVQAWYAHRRAKGEM
ncbi:MAG: endolytic transglycosylase MltG [Sphingomonadaceae bacterium]